MTHPQTRPTPAARAPRARRLAVLVVAVAATLALLAACSRTEPPASSDTGPRVVGLYEFTFDNIGTSEMTASVQRIDGGLSGQALDGTQSPQIGVSIPAALAVGAFSDPDMNPGGDRRYIWGNFEVDNGSGQDLTGLTFLGYASSGNSLNGTAFSAAKDSTSTPNIDATTIRPGARIETTILADDGVTKRPDLFKSNFVAYLESEIQPLESNLVNAYSFVDTVFPYGFAATANSDYLKGRTIGAGTKGRLFLAFDAPDLQRVVWRAVAVVDDRIRTALPNVFNHRDGHGFDDFLADAADIESNNPGAQAEVAVLGTMVDGDRSLDTVTSTGDTVDYACSAFDFVEIADVRIAGTPTAPTAWMVGGSSENETVDPILDITGSDCP